MTSDLGLGVAYSLMNQESYRTVIYFELAIITNILLARVVILIQHASELVLASIVHVVCMYVVYELTGAPEKLKK